MTESYDAVVIGAGIVGVSTALHLLMRGMTVALVDRRGAGTETSFGNAGIIGNSYVLPFGFPSLKRLPAILLDRDAGARIHLASLPRNLGWLFGFYRQSQLEARRRNGHAMWPLSARSTDEHRFLMKGTDAERYLCPDGRAALYRNEETFDADADSRAFAKELGVPFDVMDSDEFGAVEPNLKPVYRKAVRWNSSWRIKNPGALVESYAARFAREGGKLFQGDVQKLEPLGGNSWQILTGRGEFHAAQVAVCTGPWANDTLSSLGYRLPLAFKRGYHRHFAAVGNARLAHVVVDVDGGYLIAPMEQGYRLTTGIEFADVEDVPTPAQLERVLPAARELFPLGDALDARSWMGSRPCFTDSRPMIGPAPRHANLWFNFGHGHLGLTTGPASGRLLAEMMRGEKTFCDPAPYSASRFS